MIMSRMVKANILITAASLPLLASCGDGSSEAGPVDEAAVTARSAPVAQEFQQKLKAQLVAALTNGGPESAVSVCSQVAPAIAAAASEENGAEVSRIARKHRNSDAGVPATMQSQYDALAAQPLSDGKPAVQIWRSGEGENARIHYLSAITMQDQPCSVCHGTAVDPALKQHIDNLYPGDLAIGFKPGDLRGAMLISWKADAFQ